MLQVSEVSEMLASRGLGLYGPTYRGWAWYNRMENARRLVDAGQPGHYKPHADACSGFFLTAEGAATEALSPVGS